MKFIPWFYALLLKGYPASFQEAFGEEMREAFLDALDAQQERRAWMRLFLHELADWPGALLREHWVEMQRRRKEFPMTEMDSSLAGAGNAPGNGAFSQTGSWRITIRLKAIHPPSLCCWGRDWSTVARRSTSVATSPARPRSPIRLR